MIEADRELVEQGADEILDKADEDDVVLLVVGDPFGATTHADILLRAQDLEIDTKVIHNASIMNAIGCCGLQVSLNLLSQFMQRYSRITLCKILFMML